MNATNSKTARILIKIFVPCVLALLCSEFVLRITHVFGARLSWSEPHPNWGWRHSPGKKYYYVGEKGVSIFGYINSLGWRDRERYKSKLKNTFRIAVLGDSIVEALTVELDSTFCALTEDRLNGVLESPIELMNFGRSGMTQSEEYLVLQQEIVQFTPDLLVLFFLPENDIRDISRDTSPTLLRPFYSLSENSRLDLDIRFAESLEYQIKKLINPVKQHSILVSLLFERYNALMQSLRFGNLTKSVDRKGELPAYLSLGTDNPDLTYVENYRLNKVLIREMAEFCLRKNIGFLLVAAIHSHRDAKRHRYHREVDPSFDENFFGRDLGKFSALHGIDFLNLQLPFVEFFRRSSLPIVEDGHWNLTGHQIVSDALYTKLTEIFQDWSKPQ
jgi:hypothetical protein